MAPKKPLALVAMSGGVDSSVAAALMLREGYDVVGLTMQIWQESQTDPRHAGCCSLGAVEDARRVAATLGIDHYVFNFRDEFRESVIQNFIDEYAAGRTPNPCVQCNRHVKFQHLTQKAHEIGADVLVTGHYVRRAPTEDGRWGLQKARAQDKDQSYVLYMLGHDDLRNLRFPMGEAPSKAHARELARELGLHLFDKPDSQEICFVSEAGGYSEFLRKRRPEMFGEGRIVDESGRELGRHEGRPAYTVGQRKGIHVQDGTGKPLYVLSVTSGRGDLVVGRAESLDRTTVFVENFVAHRPIPEEGLEVTARIRSTMAPQPAILTAEGDRATLTFNPPVRAVSPGQIAVAYDGDWVVGGGTISGSE